MQTYDLGILGSDVFENDKKTPGYIFYIYIPLDLIESYWEIKNNLLYYII
jgi:hypothetical protein